VRKVVSYELLSLDGVAEDPMDYITDWDDEMEANLASVIADQDAVLLGRQTWDDWAAFWPTSEIEPFAAFINGVQKFVVTSTPPTPDWGPTTAVDSDLEAFLADLKSQPGGDIGVHGSIALTQALLEARLIDELRLVVAPALQLRGRRLFERAAQTRLTLSQASTSSTGYLLLEYRVEN
jgi:dihydrofolate reductase